MPSVWRGGWLGKGKCLDALPLAGSPADHVRPTLRMSWHEAGDIRRARSCNRRFGQCRPSRNPGRKLSIAGRSSADTAAATMSSPSPECADTTGSASMRVPSPADAEHGTVMRYPGSGGCVTRPGMRGGRGRSHGPRRGSGPAARLHAQPGADEGGCRVAPAPGDVRSAAPRPIRPSLRSQCRQPPSPARGEGATRRVRPGGGYRTPASVKGFSTVTPAKFMPSCRSSDNSVGQPPTRAASTIAASQ